MEQGRKIAAYGPFNIRPLPDPSLLGIYDAAGDLLEGAVDNDDGGEGYNSRLDFIPAETATYYIAAGAHASHTGAYEDYTGTYTLGVMDVLQGIARRYEYRTRPGCRPVFLQDTHPVCSCLVR